MTGVLYIIRIMLGRLCVKISLYIGNVIAKLVDSLHMAGVDLTCVS